MSETTGIRETPMLTVQGRPTPQIVREEAFRLWLSYGRSFPAVSRQLGCDEKTVRNWGKEDGWEQRRQHELAAALPGMNLESDVALTIAKYDASIRLQQIAHDAAHLGIKPDHKEVDALTRIVDRGQSTQHPTTATSDQQRDTALEGMTPLERITYLRRTLARKPPT